ncbi:MAG: hypothetical protein POELPBGB_04070 [Bacteroidia bacterium]|nr:hypothetical protein [Bacteroidia bacterium]
MSNLAPTVKVTRLMNAVAAGTSDQLSSALDMQGFDGVILLTAFGTITSGAVTSVEVHQCDTSGGSYAALTGTSIAVADDDDNQVVVHDIYRPRERYIKVNIDRGTQNAVIDGVVAIQYGARVMPTTNDSTTVVSREVHASPAEGTP